jgi:hypothetical protein
MKSFCLRIAGTISQCFLTCHGIASLRHYLVDLEISLSYEVRYRYDGSGPSVYHQLVFFLSLNTQTNRYRYQ